MQTQLANEIFKSDLEKVTLRTDRMFFWLIIGQWFFGIFLTLVWSPRTWIAQYWSIHQHVLASAFLGAFLAIYPLYLIVKQPGTAYTRHIIAIAQMLQSALLIHVTGGRIETHFHIFGSLALLAFYRDWKVLVTATVVVYIHHLALGLWFPLSVYGVTGAPVWRALEHAFWVIFEVIFLTISCRNGIKELHIIAERQAEVKEAHEGLEEKVKIRTAELVRANEELKKLDEMKNEFISLVSHELRTPITSIRGSLGLLNSGKMGELSEQAKKLVTIGFSNCERLIKLVNDILDVEKMESGKMDFTMKPLLIASLIQQAIDLNKSYADQYHVQFILEGEIPEVEVHGDNDKLIQVMTNLLSNAAKFSPSGKKIAISVTHHSPTVRISVSDQGPGIPDEFKDRIFGKFTQAKSSDSAKKGGTGLGLNISKMIIEHHQGKIGFENQKEGGTTFYFDLPEWNSSLPLTTPLPAPKPHILICEDEKDIAHLLKLMLEQANYKTDIAYSAKQACELLEKNTYQAMTLDILLPDQDGISLIHQLRKNPKTREIPMIVISAKAQTAEPEKAKLNGSGVNIIDWLQKPIETPRLLSAVDIAIKKRKKGEPFRTLYVEDDKDLVLVVSKLLENITKVVPAYSFKEAAKKIKEECFDLLLLDLILPDGDGIELLSLLNYVPGKSLPVVILSAREVDRETKQKVSAVLVKSRDSIEEIIGTIQSLLNGKNPKDS